MEGRCGDCRFFERGKWHKSIDTSEGDQLGGRCELLCELLQMTNSAMWHMKSLHVQESFGCSFFKSKDGVSDNGSEL